MNVLKTHAKLQPDKTRFEFEGVFFFTCLDSDVGVVLLRPKGYLGLKWLGTPALER